MLYPASIYNVVTALESVQVPITLDEIIIVGNIIDDEPNRAKVKSIVNDLVAANLAGSTNPGELNNREVGYIITGDHTGVELKTPDALEGDSYHKKVCTQIAVMTEFNDHLGAYSFGTSYLQLLSELVGNLSWNLQLLSELVEIEGQLAPGLSDYQHILYTRMKAIAETILDRESFESFCNSF